MVFFGSYIDEKQKRRRNKEDSVDWGLDLYSFPPQKMGGGAGLEAGDGMMVEEQGSSLVLSPAGRMEEEEFQRSEIEISSEESLDAINRKILSLYLVGYSLIEIACG